MIATLLFTAQITVVIREAVKTPVKEIAKAKPSPPFQASHYLAWGSIFLASLAATAFGGPELGVKAALPLGLAATVGGYILGEGPVVDDWTMHCCHLILPAITPWVLFNLRVHTPPAYG